MIPPRTRFLFRWFLLGGSGLLSLSACRSTSSSSGAADSSLAAHVCYERTHCFGPCPVFQATWEEDGTATLTLIRPFLEGPLASLETGTYSGKWSPGAMAEIETEARKVNYTELAAVYDNPRVMDVPSVITCWGGHEVKNRFGGPDLKPLYIAFDALMASTEWTLTSPSGGTD